MKAALVTLDRYATIAMGIHVATAQKGVELDVIVNLRIF